MLAMAGGVAGLLFARASLAAGAGLLADQVPRADEISIDAPRPVVRRSVRRSSPASWRGALPAIRAGRSDLSDALKEGGRSDAGSVGLRTRRLLIVCEVALSVVLLMGAGVMLRSLLALRNVDAGFDPRNVLTMRVTLPQTRYTDAGADQHILRHRAGAHPRAAGRPGRGRDRRPAGRRAAPCSRSSSRARRSCCRAINRPSKCARSRRAICAR